MTGHELNVKAYEALPEGKRCGHGKIEPDEFNAGFYIYRGIPQNDPARSWSPVERIEDATKLLKLLPKRNRDSCWIVKVLYRRNSVDMDLLGRPNPDGDREVVWARHDISYSMIPRAFTEAFIAATKTSK